MAKTKILICPYCGQTQPQAESCRNCGGFFEPLSRQATHNAMGPWFVREADQPFQPGCSYETLLRLIERGKVDKYTIVRGPTTKQFWTVAKRVPGLAHLLGYCHNCDASVDPEDHGCHLCGVPFGAYLDRNYMGLPDIRSLPWEAQVDADEASQFVDPASHWSRTPASASGISSFASDDELRGSSHPGRGSAHAGGSRGIRPSTEGDTAVASPQGSAVSEAERLINPSGAATSVFDEHTLTAQSRSLQRQVAHQKRTITMLAIAVVAIVLGSAAIVLTSVNSNEDKNEEAATKSVDTSVKDEAVTNLNSSIADNAIPVLEDDVAVEPALQGEIELPIDAMQQELKENYDAALKLIELAQLQERSAQARIEDYKAAIEILKSIDVTAKQESIPAGFIELLQTAERELERLEVGEYLSPEIDDGN